MKKVGMFGLTGDPCTAAHYAIVKEVLKQKLVDKVIVVPTVVDYYRKDKLPMFSYSQRKEILEKWFGDEQDVMLDFSEYAIADSILEDKNNADDLGRRRFWHTLKDLTARYGSNDYYAIAGGDSWNNLDSWYNWEELGLMVKFIVVKRNGESLKDYSMHPEYKMQPWHVIELPESFSKMSATAVRECLSGCEDKLAAYLEDISKHLAESSGDELVAHTPVFDVVKMPEVEAGFRPVKVKSPDWVSVIAERGGKLLMVKQLRFGVGRELEEFPCGTVEPGETALQAGLRELEEETGIKILDERSVHFLGKFAANPAFMTNSMHYLHVNLDFAPYEEHKPKLDEHEHLEAYWKDKNDALEDFLKSGGSSLLGCAWMLAVHNHIIKKGQDA